MGAFEIVVLSIVGAIVLATIVCMILVRVNPKVRRKLEGKPPEPEKLPTQVEYGTAPARPVKKKKASPEIPVFCKHCGKQIARDATYCDKCGKIQ